MESAHYKAIAIKQGVDPESLVRRPLTWDQYSAMSEPEKNFHLCENSKNCDLAFAAHEKEVREAVSHAKREVRKIANYEVSDVPALANLMIENGGKFSTLFPQFIGSRKNTDRVLKYMRENEMLPEVSSFIAAFTALAHEGEISIDPSKTGLTDDSTPLTGTRLQEHPNLAYLLTRVTPQIFEQRSVARMDEKAHKAWQREKEGSPEVPPMIKARIEKAFVTFTAMHPEVIFNDANKTKLLEYINNHPQPNIDYNTIRLAYESLLAAGEIEIYTNVVIREGSTTAYDYSQINRNEKPVKPVPTPTVQENLERKIKNMTSEEYDKWIQTPANRRAADNLR
jgi:hypothetical protein